MNLRIKRRRFGQLAIATAASTAIMNLAGKVVAQSTPGNIVGAKPDTSTPSNANTTPQIKLTTSDAVTGNVQKILTVASTTVNNASTQTETAPKSTTTETSDRLTGLTAQPTGELVKASVSNSKDGNVTQLIFTDPNTSKVTKSLKVSGFANNNSTIESLLATTNNSLLSINSLKEGYPPFELALIDNTTGKVTNSTAAGLPQLDPNRRYSNLAQAPDGTIYGTTLGREGTTSLVRIDLRNKSVDKVVQLSYNNKPLTNDLLSLAISPSTGQLYALANLDYKSINSLYTVDVKTGVLSFLRQFDAHQITFSR